MSGKTIDRLALSQAVDNSVRLSKNSFRLVLGSRSPRRRQLLDEQGYRYEVLPSQDGVEEQAERELSGIAPELYVERLAYFKAENVVEQLRNNAGRFTSSLFANETSPFIALSCDSVAVCKGNILGKPQDRADAERMLRMLSGSRHVVHTGVCVWRYDPTAKFPEKILRQVETSTLLMDELTEEQLTSYLSSGLWEGKAGAFGYQDGNDWLKLISGTESNVVGLPVEALAFLLQDVLN